MSETRRRLAAWGIGSRDSEYLAAEVLVTEDFKDIDPIHPLGGPDGGKDILCTKNSVLCTAACYFPNDSGTITHTSVANKFESDISKIDSSQRPAFVFLTNCSVTAGERDALREIAAKRGLSAEIYHLERLRLILDSPTGIHIRNKYLNIPITTEEQLAFSHHLFKLVISPEQLKLTVEQIFEEKISKLSNVLKGTSNE